MNSILSQTKHVTTADRQKISFDHYKRGHKNAVIIAHGFFNSKKSVLLKQLGEALNDTYDVIIMDFRGHGESPGLFYWTAKEYLDLTAVLEYARPDYERLAVIGFSLGAATSIITASKCELIDAVIAVSGPTDFDKIDFRFWDLDVENDILYNLADGKIGKGVRPGPFWLKKDKPINLVGKLTIPIFYIHGEADWLIKPHHSKELYEKTISEKRLALIKNGPHAEYLIRKNNEETVQLMRQWLKTTLCDSPRTL